MNKQELILEIKDEANRRAGKDPKTGYVLLAKAAIRVIRGLDLSAS